MSSMKERIILRKGSVSLPQQRPLYASDEDDSENDTATAVVESSSLEEAHTIRSLHDRNHHLEEDTDAESENCDDEMMNPYVMKPNFQTMMGRSRNLDSAALLPPSMELADVTKTQRGKPQSTPGKQLDIFDPYSQTQNTLRKSLEDMQLELEEESIDFMPSSHVKKNTSYKPTFTMFGPLVHEHQSLKEREKGNFQDCESTFTDSTSFSPVFSKHQKVKQRQNHYSNSNAEYGEAMPLSGNPNAYRQRNDQYHGGGPMGTVKALGGGILSWIRGGYVQHNTFSHATRRHYGRPSLLAYFRLFVIVLAAMFALSTMAMMKHMLFSEIDTSSTVVKYQEEAAAKSSTSSNGNVDLSVMKKIENARLKAREKKQHWWNRKKTGDINAGMGETEATKNSLEIYLNGEKQGVVQVDSGSIEDIPDAVVNDSAIQGVIVESAEDGTLLIKLPPPKMHLEQPSLIKGSPHDGLAASTEQDETVLIRLPFPEQRRSLFENSDSDKETRFNYLPFNEHHKHDHDSRILESLRSEFDSWASKHNKSYSSHKEKERRFQIWRGSHERIKKKNKMHGPCRLTGKAVFGHGPFSDLSPSEFRETYLTGYNGQEKKAEAAQASRAMNDISPRHHPTIQRKLEEHIGSTYQGSFVSGCRSWVDFTCMLRKIFGYAIMGGTMEPYYDEDNYPSALDWRALGIVSSVHSQNTCGACWAITAVETIESAYAIQSGKLIDLDEEEVISCDGTCEMCDGGWPQNAYDYVMKHNGLPKKSRNYDSDFLLTLTMTLNGESSELSEYEVSSYFSQICPAGTREGGGDNEADSHSGDGQYGTGSYVPRYGNIKGYGYATDRCVCYSDGSGCDCDTQNEKTAVLNIASHGPAAVCVEASTWADYSSGIITSASGCSSSFEDMNHCVETVGYVFTDVNDDDYINHSGDSKDDGKREGYWIVKNQWSTYWGMSGYAYVEMGDNTCGILNDMTQVYMEED